MSGATKERAGLADIRNLLLDQSCIRADIPKGSKLELYFGPDAQPVLLLSRGEAGFNVFVPVTSSPLIEETRETLKARFARARRGCVMSRSRPAVVHCGVDFPNDNRNDKRYMAFDSAEDLARWVAEDPDSRGTITESEIRDDVILDAIHEGGRHKTWWAMRARAAIEEAEFRRWIQKDDWLDVLEVECAKGAHLPAGGVHDLHVRDDGVVDRRRQVWISGVHARPINDQWRGALHLARVALGDDWDQVIWYDEDHVDHDGDEDDAPPDGVEVFRLRACIYDYVERREQLHPEPDDE